jgi:hypothetical protein
MPVQMPNELFVVDGRLKRRGGGSVREYLSRSPVANAESVVLLKREDAQRMANDANNWRAQEALKSAERFSLAA